MKLKRPDGAKRIGRPAHLKMHIISEKLHIMQSPEARTLSCISLLYKKEGGEQEEMNNYSNFMHFDLAGQNVNRISSGDLIPRCLFIILLICNFAYL